MHESTREPQSTFSPPIQMKADGFGVAQKPKHNSPYGGTPLKVSGKLANRIKESFGIKASELALRESPEVARMGARATAQGNAIRFAPGEFRPDTAEGLEVLGHELNHVKEQSMGGVHAPGGSVYQDAGHESRSDSAGTAFAGGGISSATPVSVGGINVSAAPVQMWPWSKKKFGPKKPTPEQIAQIQVAESLRQTTENAEATNAMLENARATMRERLQSGDIQGAHEMVKEEYQQFMIPEMQKATSNWQGKTEGNNIVDAGVIPLRGRNAFAVKNAEYLKHILSNETSGAMGVIDNAESQREANGQAPVRMESGETEEMVVQILESIKGNLSNNAHAKDSYREMDSALSQVDFYSGNKNARDRTNLNNMMLRVFTPAIVDRTSKKVGKNEKGIPNPMTPEQEIRKRNDANAGKMLQNSINDFTNDGNQSAGENRNRLHDIFDSLIAELNTPMQQAAHASPVAEAALAPALDAVAPDLGKESAGHGAMEAVGGMDAISEVAPEAAMPQSRARQNTTFTTPTPYDGGVSPERANVTLNPRTPIEARRIQQIQEAMEKIKNKQETPWDMLNMESGINLLNKKHMPDPYQPEEKKPWYKRLFGRK